MKDIVPYINSPAYTVRGKNIKFWVHSIIKWFNSNEFNISDLKACEMFEVASEIKKKYIKTQYPIADEVYYWIEVKNDKENNLIVNIIRDRDKSPINKGVD